MLDKIETWALGEYGKAPATVYETLRRLRRLVRLGLGLGAFRRSRRAARATGNRVLAAVKREAEARRAGSSRGAARNAQKALNWLVDYHGYGKGARWVLEREPTPRKRRLSPEQIARAAAYAGRTPFLTARGRAVVWIMQHTGLRRGELARVRRRDAQEGQLWVEHPMKDGRQRWVPLPAPMGALGHWLAMLPRRTPRDALWITRDRWGHIKAMTVNGFSAECSRISSAVGFRIGATTYRRTRARNLHKEYGVSVAAIKTAYGHRREATTWLYIGDLDDQDVAAEYARAGVPGFNAAQEATPLPSAP